MKKKKLWREGAGYLKDKQYPFPENDSRFLLQHLLHEESHLFYGSLDKNVSLSVEKKFWSLLERLGKGEPLAYILKSAQFMGLNFYVDSRVLIPRPETELLVEAVLDHAAFCLPERPVILDIGTGSGCILISLAHFLKKGLFVGTDISIDALMVAKKNAGSLCAASDIYFLKTDLCQALKNKPQFDVIVTNPPYVASKDPSVEKSVAAYEPSSALFAGREGKEYITRILLESQFLLRNTGLLFMEIGYNLFDWSVSTSTHFNFSLVQVIKDYQGIKRHLVLKPDT